MRTDVTALSGNGSIVLMWSARYRAELRMSEGGRGCLAALVRQRFEPKAAVAKVLEFTA